MSSEQLRSIGWKPFFEQQVSIDFVEFRIARVSAHHGSQLLLLGKDGEFSVPIQLADRKGESDIAVGDWLVLDANNRVLERLDRQTMLHRKAAGTEVKPQAIAANVDTVFIVTSCNEDFNLSRIERYLALILQSGATPVVVLTKADLVPDAAELRRQTERLHPGLLVETIDARDPEQTKALIEWCDRGRTVALLGSSGVGKSTLANALGAPDLATGGIREHDGKGRHTTTARSLHRLPSGGVLIDNPGIRELQLPACEDGVAELFDDVYLIARNCRFRDCRHEGDAGCAIHEAIEAGQLDERRFVSFKKLAAEQAHNSRSLAERHERDRAFGKLYKSTIAAKKKSREQT